MTAKGELTKFQRNVLHTAYIIGYLDAVPGTTLTSLRKRGLIEARGDDWVLNEAGLAAAKNLHKIRTKHHREAGR